MVSLCDNPFQIGVFGSGSDNPLSDKIAYEVGQHIARKGHILVNGGMGGVMHASARGASDEGGLVVGILPGTKFSEGNHHTTVKILTGMHYARNFINALSCHGCIVVAGSSGTYEEARRVWEGRGPVVVIDDCGSSTGAAAAMIQRQKDLGMAFPEDKEKPWKIHVASGAEEAVSMLVDQVAYGGYLTNES